MKFDGTITLGTIVVVVTFLGGLIVAYTRGTTWLARRFEQLTNAVEDHTAKLTAHGERMDRYEARYVEIAGQLQRLIGREEGDRRGGRRRS